MDAKRLNPNNEMLKDTLRHLSYDQEDINAIFENFQGKMGLDQAVNLLDERKKRRMLWYNTDLNKQQQFNTVVISSDSESDDGSHQETHKNLTTNAKHQFEKSYHSLDYSDSSFDLLKGDILESAKRDLPSELDFCEWFKERYQPLHDAVVLKEDMLHEFCEHFNVPSYPELEDLFFEKVSKLLKETLIYNDVECIENACYDGLKKAKPCTMSETVQALLMSTKLSSGLAEASSRSKSAIKKEKVPTLAVKFPSSQTGSGSLTSQIQKTFSSPESTKTFIDSKQPIVIEAESKTETQFKSGKHFPSLHSSQASTSKESKLPPKSKEIVQSANDTSKLNPVELSNLSNHQLLHLPKNPGLPGLRHVVIDGSNVACDHGNGTRYSCRGIALCVRYFWLRGHRQITCFVPNFRKGPSGNPPPFGQEVLFKLEKMNICKFTPSRRVKGKNIVCYDDRFILDLADQTNGVVVSNDQFRDLLSVNKKWKDVIEKRLLPYLFVEDLFMPATDPLGKNGPDLDDFLKLETSSFSESHGQFGFESSSGMYNKAAGQHRYKRNHGESSSPYEAFYNPTNKMHEHQKRIQDEQFKPNNYATTSSPSFFSSDQMKKQLIDLFPEKEEDIDQLLRLNPEATDIDVLANELFVQDDAYY